LLDIPERCCALITAAAAVVAVVAAASSGKHWHISLEERQYLEANSSRTAAQPPATANSSLIQYGRSDLSAQVQSVNFDTASINNMPKLEALPIPWLKIFSTPACWALITANFCNNWVCTLCQSLRMPVLT
jgi:hypothetical protein